jgi:hypothetical protein
MIVTIVSELILNIRKSKELIKNHAKRFINGDKIMWFFRLQICIMLLIKIKNQKCFYFIFVLL